jgi:D-galactarolactone cycloisomerase
MKIESIEAFELIIPYKVPFKPAHEPGRIRNSRSFTVVRIRASGGLVGYTGCDGHHKANISRNVAPYLVGLDVFETETHARIYRNAGGVGAWFLDMAIWDIIGKAANMPVHKLWGVARDKVRAYASAPSLLCKSELADLCQRYRDEGFKAIKIRIHNDQMQDDIAFFEAARDAVPDLILMADANQANNSPAPNEHPYWDYRRGYQTAKELQRLGCYWLEEPFPYGRWDDYVRLTDVTEMYIAGGETLPNLHMFRDVMLRKVFNVVQPDPIYSEGISQLRKIGALSEMLGIPCMPHMASSGLGDAANLHLCCTLSGEPWFEFMYEPPSRTIEVYQQLGGILQSKIWIDSDGFVQPSTNSGFGIEVDESAIDQYQVE